MTFFQIFRFLNISLLSSRSFLPFILFDEFCPQVHELLIAYFYSLVVFACEEVFLLACTESKLK